jgi:hypothetical protein
MEGVLDLFLDCLGPDIAYDDDEEASCSRATGRVSLAPRIVTRT